VEVVRTETADVPAATVAAVDAGGFAGELNLLTGQNVHLLCRVREGGTVYRVPPERLRQLMANDAELSDIVFKALIARRELLQRSTAAQAMEIVGADRSAAALALRTYAARQRLIHLWFDAGTPAGRAMMESCGLTEDDLPAVALPGATLKQATPGALADKLGLSYRRSSAKPADVTIVGAARPAWRPRFTGRPRAWTPSCWTPSAPAGRPRPVPGSRTTSASRSAFPAPI